MTILFMTGETCFKAVVLKQPTELQDGKRQESVIFWEGGEEDGMLAERTAFFLLKVGIHPLFLEQSIQEECRDRDIT